MSEEKKILKAFKKLKKGIKYGLDGDVPQSLNYKAIDNKALFKSIVAKPIALAKGEKPNHEVFKHYLETINIFTMTAKGLGPYPTEGKMKEFGTLVDKMKKLLETKEFKRHYEPLYSELVMSEETTRRLIGQRKENPKPKKITPAHKLRMCEELIRWWKSHTFKDITGTYDNKGPHLGEYYDTQNINVNPGAYFIQQVFGEYFGDRMNNRQIKELITETNKVFK